MEKLHVIYVIVRKEDGSVAMGGGTRKIQAYTSRGRAEYAMQRSYGSQASQYTVLPFIAEGGEDESL